MILVFLSFVILFAQVKYRVYGPTFLPEVLGVVGAVVGGVSNKIGIIIERALIDGKELMSTHIGVV
jgi:hypothetical protein